MCTMRRREKAKMEQNEQKLSRLLQTITEPDENARKEAHKKWNDCAKPLGSLGLLETAVENIAALTGSAEISLFPRAVLVMCADNGVIAQGVTQSAANVTAVVTENLAMNRTAVCRMASVANCQVVPVDLGVLNFPPMDGVLRRRIANATGDISKGPAMTREQAAKAVLTGIELVFEQKNEGVRLIATGEMGVGNTTTSSAVACALLKKPVKEMTGRGAGLSDEGMQRKIHAIEQALFVNRPNSDDALDVLSKVGGFDLAAICGVFLGGAIYRVPILADGFISTIAALCAVRMCKKAEKAIFASHVSAEPAGQTVLRALNREPLITAKMRLGEGTGAVAAIPLLDMACAVYQESYTFEQGGIEHYVPYGDAE